MILAETDKAYIAGCLDCDGSVVIRRHTRNKRTQYYLVVDFANTSPELMRYLQNRMPKAQTLADNRQHRRQTCYSLKLWGPAAVELLEEVYPYVRGKRDQVSLAILFSRLKDHHQGVKYSDKEMSMFETLCQEMKQLKRKRYGR